MIESLSIVNNKGQIRFTQSFQSDEKSLSQKAVDALTLFQLIKDRPRSNANCIRHPESDDSFPRYVVYRSYATLYFIVVISDAESELATLDLIQVNVILVFPLSSSQTLRGQVIVESFDKYFGKVCELDLIFNPVMIQSIVQKIIMGGFVIETNPLVVVDQLRKDEAQLKEINMLY
ncbi:hypothetical protein MIR68_000887 [Amoeboaphelidium protococcarum]|nr:hypothetical protein MIR68_000887 [Amoeboaphelidium protococcarum]